MLTGLYVPVDSLVHRLPAGAKVVLLLVFTTLLVALATPTTITAAALAVLAGYTAARLPLRVLWAQVWPMRWVVLLLVPLQWWSSGPATAYVVVGTLVVSVAAASLVTTTTRLEAMLDTFTRAARALRPFGVDPDRVGLLAMLTIRMIPVITEVLATSREAQLARGLERSTVALVAPTVVRTIDHATATGEALAARGLGD